MIRFKAFGTPLLQRDDEPAGPGAAQRRRFALLALLATAGDAGMSRDKLVGYLWPDAPEEQARHALAQTLYLLRRDLDGADIVLGTSELRLNPATVWTDVGDFVRAAADGDADRAAAAYTGPFLDGFYLANAPEFERWVETERSRYAAQARGSWERAARDAASGGDPHRAVEWWRRVAAADPLDARGAVGLMEALAAVGDRSGALQHARVHETLVREELDAPVDASVSAVIDRLRAAQQRPGVAPADDTSRAAAPQPASSEPAPPRAPATTGATFGTGEHRRTNEYERTRRREAMLRGALGGALLVVLVGGGARVALSWHRTSGDANRHPTYAIGAVRDYTGIDSSGIARAITDMLATNLARVPDLRVVSNARIYEVMGMARARNGDLSAQISTAAREAGATELIEGTLYRHQPGVLRFDVRRVDLASGAIRKAYSVEGDDPFDLVDRATAELAGDIGSPAAAPLKVADVTTRSLIAYRFYEEGLRAYYQQNDAQAALRLFLAALAEDSAFAMAEFYAAKAAEVLGTDSVFERYAHAARLAPRATDRERLLIQGSAALMAGERSAVAIAETLATRYPAEPDGHYLLGNALTSAGDFLGAVPHLRRVVAMDSLSLSANTLRCRACAALSLIATALWDADSVREGERVAREWVRAQPGSSWAWESLSAMLLFQNRFDEARAADRAAMRLSPTPAKPIAEAFISMRSGQFAVGDSILRAWYREDPRADAGWLLTLSLRYQGRLREALDLARRPAGSTSSAAASQPNLAAAIVLFDMGRYRAAADIFSALAARPAFPFTMPARDARSRAWNLTHEATALAAAGDTVMLARLADSIQVAGALSAFGRDQRLHHYVRGLLLRARGQLPAAADEMRRGLFSLTDGYTRNSYELARTLLAMRRAPQAIAILQPAFRGSLQGSNSYVTHTELHEALAEAFEMAGQRDSAAAHYDYVVRAWARADAPLRERWTRARAKLATLQ